MNADRDVPPTPSTGSPVPCGAEHDGFSCRREKGHRGPHVGKTGESAMAWFDRKRPPT